MRALFLFFILSAPCAQAQGGNQEYQRLRLMMEGGTRKNALRILPLPSQETPAKKAASTEKDFEKILLREILAGAQKLSNAAGFKGWQTFAADAARVEIEFVDGSSDLTLFPYEASKPEALLPKRWFKPSQEHTVEKVTIKLDKNLLALLKKEIETLQPEGFSSPEESARRLAIFFIPKAAAQIETASIAGKLGQGRPLPNHIYVNGLEETGRMYELAALRTLMKQNDLLIRNPKFIVLPSEYSYLRGQMGAENLHSPFPRNLGKMEHLSGVFKLDTSGCEKGNFEEILRKNLKAFDLFRKSAGYFSAAAQEIEIFLNEPNSMELMCKTLEEEKNKSLNLARMAAIDAQSQIYLSKKMKWAKQIGDTSLSAADASMYHSSAEEIKKVSDEIISWGIEKAGEEASGTNIAVKEGGIRKLIQGRTVDAHLNLAWGYSSQSTTDIELNSTRAERQILRALEVLKENGKSLIDSDLLTKTTAIRENLLLSSIKTIEEFINLHNFDEASRLADSAANWLKTTGYLVKSTHKEKMRDTLLYLSLEKKNTLEPLAGEQEILMAHTLSQAHLIPFPLKEIKRIQEYFDVRTEKIKNNQTAGFLSEAEIHLSGMKKLLPYLTEHKTNFEKVNDTKKDLMERYFAFVKEKVSEKADFYAYEESFKRSEELREEIKAPSTPHQQEILRTLLDERLKNLEEYTAGVNPNKYEAQTRYKASMFLFKKAEFKEEECELYHGYMERLDKSKNAIVDMGGYTDDD